MDAGRGAAQALKPEELRLWTRYGYPPPKGSPDPRSQIDRDALVLHYHGLPEKIVLRYWGGKFDHSEAALWCLNDAIAAGKVGLVQGVQRFDIRRGFQPGTYLTSRICGAVKDEQRRVDHLDRQTRAEVKSGKKQEPRAYSTDFSEENEDGKRQGNRRFQTGDNADSRDAYKEALKAALGKLGTKRRVEAFLLYHVEGGSLRDCYAHLQGWRDSDTSMGVPNWVAKFVQIDGAM